MRPAERRTIHRPTGYLGYGRDDCDCGPHIANRQLDVSRGRAVQDYLDPGRPAGTKLSDWAASVYRPTGMVLKR